MKNYKVNLWSGMGYILDEVIVKAEDMEDALIEASKSIGWFVDSEDSLFDELSEEEEKGIELENWLYLDRTTQGASVGYLYMENAKILELNKV